MAQLRNETEVPNASTKQWGRDDLQEISEGTNIVLQHPDLLRNLFRNENVCQCFLLKV